MTTKLLKTLADQQSLPSWGLSQAVTGLNIAVEVYVLLSLVFHGVRTKKLSAPWNRATTRLLLLGILTPSVHLINIAVTESQLILPAVLDLGVNTTAANHACDVSQHTKMVTYAIASLPAFAFLWYRQHSLYCLDSLLNVNTLVAKVVSGFLITLLVVMSPALAVYDNTGSFYLMTAAGCAFHPLYEADYSINNAAAAAHLITGVLLFGLFVYPLAQAKTIKLTGYVQQLIKKALYSILLYEFSDVVALIVCTFCLPNGWPRYVTSVAYDCSLAVHSVSIVVSFNGHWDIFFGWLPGHQQVAVAVPANCPERLTQSYSSAI